jgi:hypothetical protein
MASLYRVREPFSGFARGQLIQLGDPEGKARLGMKQVRLLSEELGEKVARDLSLGKRHVAAEINYQAGQHAAEKAAQELRAAILDEARQLIVQALASGTDSPQPAVSAPVDAPAHRALPMDTAEPMWKTIEADEPDPTPLSFRLRPGSFRHRYRG